MPPSASTRRLNTWLRQTSGSLLESVGDSQIGYLNNRVQRSLVLIVGQQATPFPRPCDVRRHLVHQIRHVRLIPGATPGGEIGPLIVFEAVGKVDLPLLVQVELRLCPAAGGEHTMFTGCADRQNRLARGDAKQAQTAS